MDLSPRISSDNAPLAPRSSGKKKWRYVAMLAVVVTAGGFIVSQFLTSAIDFYCNVDEIGSRAGCEENRRLRVQGNVIEGSIAESASKTTFSLEFNDKVIQVLYEGDPGGIFQECIPVVAHGRLVGDVFESNRIEVRHSNEYEAENADRMIEPGAAACSQQVG